MIDQQNTRISIITPIYNEEDNIKEFYTRMRKVIDQLPFTCEIIFINDGSTDTSYEVLLALRNKDECVKILNLSRNFGKELALSAGLDHATGNAVIPIDADLQDSPELIPRMIEKWQEGYEVVYAVRTLRKRESIFKRLTAVMFYKTIRMLTSFNIPENTGDFRLLDRKVVNAIKELREYHRFMKGLFSWVGFKQVGISFERDARHAGKTKWNYVKLYRHAIDGITSFSIMPLRFSSFIGMLISFFSIIYGAFIIIKTLIFSDPVPGYPSLITIILFLGGIQLLTIGIIGEYVGRIYNESKHRALYIIREKHGL